jgi:hypothetical protein
MNWINHFKKCKLVYYFLYRWKGLITKNVTGYNISMRCIFIMFVTIICFVSGWEFCIYMKESLLEGEGLHILTYTLSCKRSFTCQCLPWHDTFVFKVIFETPVISTTQWRVSGKGAITTYAGILTLAQPGFELTTSWSRSERSTSFREWLIDYLLFYVPLKNFSLTWRRHQYRWRTAKLRPMLSAQGLWAGRGSLSCHTCCNKGPQFFWSNLKDRPI